MEEMIVMKSIIYQVMKLAVRMKLPMVINRETSTIKGLIRIVDEKLAVDFLQVKLLCLSCFSRKAPNERFGSLLT